MARGTYFTFIRKNILVDRPKPATTYEIIRYYKGGFDMNLKMIKPIPRTTKFDINVKVFLRLFNLSLNNKKFTLRFLEHVSEGTRLM